MLRKKGRSVSVRRNAYSDFIPILAIIRKLTVRYLVIVSVKHIV
jgi:hypothetical protein